MSNLTSGTIEDSGANIILYGSGFIPSNRISINGTLYDQVAPVYTTDGVIAFVNPTGFFPTLTCGNINSIELDDSNQILLTWIRNQGCSGFPTGTTGFGTILLGAIAAVMAIIGYKSVRREYGE